MKQPDLEAYVLGEQSAMERAETERYLESHPEAALEVERLRLVVSSLRHVPEEEPPRRIAFVSDKVFEPKWYQRFWQSAPQLGFAGAAMLAVAIVIHGAMAPAVPETAAPQNMAALVEQEVAKRLDAAIATAVTKAVVDVRTNADRESQKLVATAMDQAEKKFAIERQQDRLAVEASFEIMRKQMNRVLYLASNERGTN